MLKLFIGTSGWNYSHWKEVFYPAGLSQNKWLRYYANFFNSVELNVTFYRIVRKKTFENWYKNTPKNFYFIAKGNRFITHIKKLKGCKDSLDLFFSNSSALEEKLACVLWQFPPSYKKNLASFESFLKILKKFKVRQAFEFRNDSWFDEEVYDLLKAKDHCLCIADSSRWPCTKQLTASFVYLRFHGRDGVYSGNYSDGTLKEWALFAKNAKRDVFAFFNNDSRGHAVKNALEFRELLR